MPSARSGASRGVGLRKEFCDYEEKESDEETEGEPEPRGASIDLAAAAGAVREEFFGVAQGGDLLVGGEEFGTDEA